MSLLEEIISDKPRFHAGETELRRPFELGESLLNEAVARRLFSSGLMHYGIDDEVLRYLYQTVGERSRTLETGAGSSTLVFAIRRARHTVITPSVEEIQRIRAYAERHGILLDSVEFVAQPSERFLPNSHATDLDVILIDGKHAFPGR